MIKRLWPACLLVLLLAGAGCMDRSGDANEPIATTVSTNLAKSNVLTATELGTTRLPDDVHPAQAGSMYRLGDRNDAVLLLFVLQKNMNVPLLALPAGVETTWGGVVASADGGATWERLLSYENPKVEYGMVRANPVGMFVDDGRLYVDVADALGAGSGEGNLTRFALGQDGTTWTSAGCYYYVQENYRPQNDLALGTSENCLVEP